MTRPVDILPDSLAPRGLRLEAAACYLGESVDGFKKMVAEGFYPQPIPRPGQVSIWDRQTLDDRLDELSGRLSPAQQWDLDQELGIAH